MNSLVQPEYLPQLFSFPSDVISSMLENPSSSKGLMKLYQTCKYFYAKRPILIADIVMLKKGLRGHTDQNPITEIIVANKNIFGFSISIWPTNEVWFQNYCDTKLRLPEFLRYSVKKILLNNSQIFYDDFVLLTSEKLVTEFSETTPQLVLNQVRYSYIYHPDMSKVTIDEILRYLPNVRKFSYYIDENCTAEILTKLIEIKFNRKFHLFKLKVFDVHPSFDMNIFCKFITKNSNYGTLIHMNLRGTSKEKLKLALSKLNPKWRKEANKKLREFFNDLNPKWEEEMDD